MKKVLLYVALTTVFLSGFDNVKDNFVGVAHASTVYSPSEDNKSSEIVKLEQAAEQGDSEAQFYLGVIYYNGYGVRRNKRTAKEWFGKACDNGDQLGCHAYRELNGDGF